jgi:hypothetical protein
MFSLLWNLFADTVNSLAYGNTLDKVKIDRNIEHLKQHVWFSEVYDDEKFHRLFFVNKHISRYLQRGNRVKKLIEHKKSQEKFIILLHEQSDNY